MKHIVNTDRVIKMLVSFRELLPHSVQSKGPGVNCPTRYEFELCLTIHFVKEKSPRPSPLFKLCWLFRLFRFELNILHSGTMCCAVLVLVVVNNRILS